MKTTTYYEVSRNSEYTDDGIPMCEHLESFLKLESAVKQLEEHSVDYIDIDDKLHQWNDKKQKYDIVDDPEEYYPRSEGEYLGVDVITECKLHFSDVDQNSQIFIEIND